MTSLPAGRLGLTDRGVLAPGRVADLVLFDPERVVDRATFEQPHRFCEGVRMVVVGGEAVVEDGEDTGVVAGTVLRRGSGN
jgi:N-acyl-D-amino-acid deacylase